MVPEITGAEPEIMAEASVVRQPSYGYFIDFKNKRIRTTIDKEESVKQSIYMILNTERYRYVIYPWTYGFETMDLYGENPYLVTPRLQKRIFDALYQDDRITDITDFKAVRNDGIYSIIFTVNTIFGTSTEIEWEVEI